MLSAAVVGLAGTHGHSEELMLWLLNLRGPEPEHMQADPSLQHLAGADRALTREPASMSSPLAGKEREGEEAFAPGQLFVAKLRLAFKLMGIRGIQVVPAVAVVANRQEGSRGPDFKFGLSGPTTLGEH